MNEAEKISCSADGVQYVCTRECTYECGGEKAGGAGI